MPLQRVPDVVCNKINAIRDKRGYKSFGKTLEILLGNLDPEDIPEVGAFTIQIGIKTKTKPFLKRRTIIKESG